ncbi:MAG: GNAT family N-acetyltransferase, partial [Acetatifactor sp.]|nr:GNAT family N-acetyltransferase [Acetatifactor sp.]
IYDRSGNVCMITATDETTARDMIALIPKDIDYVTTQQEFVNKILMQEYAFVEELCCRQVCYTKGEPLPVKHKDIRLLDDKDIPYLLKHYEHTDQKYVRDRIAAHALFGADVDGKLVGFIGIHDEGSIGLLYVEEEYRRKGIATSLESYVINKQRELGFIPYGHIQADNNSSLKLQEKIGLYQADNYIWWMKNNACNV